MREIAPEQLKIGMFIVLRLPWWKHPFLVNSFKILTVKQLETIRSLRLDKVIYDSDRSDVQAGPRPTLVSESPPPEEREEEGEFYSEMRKIKEKKLDFLRRKQEMLRQCDRKYNESLKNVSDITREISAGNPDAVKRAGALIGDMVDILKGEAETVMVHLINTQEMERITLFHALNVCILALIVGRDLGLNQEQLNALGMGALIHDIGKAKIPKKVILKKPPLTKAEETFLHMHPEYGYEIASRLSNISQDSLTIIMQHHESLAGTGYPESLSGDRIHPLSLIASIANIYDNLCNWNPEGKITPHEAVRLMYQYNRQDVPMKVLESFIRAIGVYPPGTLVELSDGQRGIVLSTDKKKRLKPVILVYSEEEPIDGPIILDAALENVDVVATLSAEDLTKKEFEYLRPDRGVGFYVHREK